MSDGKLRTLLMDPAADIAVRYMTRFVCIAENCTDSCCQGWQASLDRDAYEKLKGAMIRSPETWMRFLKAVRPTEDDFTQTETYAYMRSKKGRGCAFWESDERCWVWKTYGYDFLGNVCALYPRVIGRLGDRLEVTASLSCPEAARLCLLSDDGLEWVPLSEAPLSRTVIHHSQPADSTTDARIRFFDVVRDMFADVLENRHSFVATRIALCAGLGREADKLAAKKGLDHVDLDALREPWGPLKAMPASTHPLTAEEGLAVWRGIMPPGKEGKKTQAGLHALVRTVWPLDVWPDEGPTPDAWRLYEEGRARWAPQWEKRIDLYFERYSVNHLYKDWFTAAKSMQGYWERLELWMAFGRALFFSHARLAEAPDDLSPEEVESLLDEHGVWTLQKLSKAVEHASVEPPLLSQPALMKLLQRA